MRTPNNERVSSDIAEARPARKSEPERKCILSGEHGARGELVRLAISPDGLVLPDIHAKAPAAARGSASRAPSWKPRWRKASSRARSRAPSRARR